MLLNQYMYFRVEPLETSSLAPVPNKQLLSDILKGKSGEKFKFQSVEFGALS